MFRFFSQKQGDRVADDVPRPDGYAAGPRAPERPPLPRPEGLNRNALTIAAVIMGTIVIAAVVFMQPSRPISATVSRQAPTPSLDQSTFLDQPPAQTINSREPGGPTGRPGVADSLQGSSLLQKPETTAAIGRSEGLDSPYAQPVVVDRDGIREARIEAFHAALVAPVTIAGEVEDNVAHTVRDRGGADREGAPSIARSPSENSSTRTTESLTPRVPNLSSQSEVRTGVTVDSAPSPYAVQAGTLMPAILITEVNSDLPGQVLAQVARDVYDTRSQRTLLIPSGAKLIGTYEDQVPVGRDRLLVAWTRILLPDGRSISLPGLQTKDRGGAGGVGDRVDRHMRRTFATTALLSLIGAGLQLSQPRGAITAGGYFPSTGEIAAAAVGQQLAEVAEQLLKRDLDVRPTIRIRQGLQFNVFLNTDLVFQEPYERR